MIPFDLYSNAILEDIYLKINNLKFKEAIWEE